MEPIDHEILGNPDKYIIAPGGEIFFALQDGVAVGTCAAQCLPSGEWELAKLGVDENCQGRGVGRGLCQRVIDYCRSKGARRVIIETNSSLAPALGLYRSLGFVPYVPAEPSPFARCDTTLELVL